MKQLFAVVLLLVFGLTSFAPVAALPQPQEDPIDQPGSLPDASAPEGEEPAQASGPLPIAREWEMHRYGDNVGAAGLIVQDLTGDGSLEIVTTTDGSSGLAEDNYWYVMRKTGPNQYQQVWVSGEYTLEILHLAAGDVNRDGIVEIFLAFQDGTVHAYRGSDFALLSSFTVQFRPESMVLADVDDNGIPELLLSSYADLFAYHPLNRTKLWSRAGNTGRVAVGNVDGDAATEIVLASGAVLSGATRMLEWQYNNQNLYNFGQRVQIGDIDGDGIGEIVGLDSNYITVFDAVVQSPLWQISAYGAKAMHLVDINQDGRAEILYADYPHLYAIDGLTQQQLWKLKSPSNGALGIAVADTDQDNALELLWSCAGSYTGGVFFVADLATHTIEWKANDLEGPYPMVAIGDVDDDGAAEMLMTVTEIDAGNYRAGIHILNGQTHAIEWDSGPIASIYNSIIDVQIGDVDQDGRTEYIIAADENGYKTMQVYDGQTHALERQSPTSSSGFTALELGDVDGDGQMEIVAGQEYSQETRLFVFDGATLALEWQSVSLGWSQGVYDITLHDLNDDGRLEIAASVKERGLFVFDGTTHVQKTFLPITAYALAGGDFDGDGWSSLAVGLADGKIAIYRGDNFGLQKTLAPGSGPVTCLRTADVNQDTSLDLLACSQNRLLIYSIPGQALLWQSNNLGKELGEYNRVAVGQMDADSDLEIVIGSRNALYQLASPWSGPLALSQMSVSPKRAQPGELVTFQAVLKNQSGNQSYPVQFSNPVPLMVDFVSGSLKVSKGTVDAGGGVISWFVELPPRSSATLTYQATVKPKAPRAPLVNTAYYTGAGSTQSISVRLFIPPAQVFLPICNRYFCGNLEDHFDQENAGWPVINDAYMQTVYDRNSNIYRILAKNPGYIYTVKAPTCTRQSYTVETRVFWRSLENSGMGYGLIFGLTEDFSQYYMLLINTDYQVYSLFYRGPDGFEQLSPWKYSGAIETGYYYNRISATRNGSQITAQVNGSPLETWSDRRIMGMTSVGLVVAPYDDTPNAEAIFDDFWVTLLPDASYGPGAAQSMAVDPMAVLSGLTFDRQPLPETLHIPDR